MATATTSTGASSDFPRTRWEFLNLLFSSIFFTSTSPLQYDRAALTVMVQTEAASKEDKFINDFFINDEL